MALRIAQPIRFRASSAAFLHRLGPYSTDLATHACRSLSASPEKADLAERGSDFLEIRHASISGILRHKLIQRPSNQGRPIIGDVIPDAVQKPAIFFDRANSILHIT